MPYKVRRGSGKNPWKIVRSDTGQVVGASATKQKAQASARARYAAESKSGSTQRR